MLRLGCIERKKKKKKGKTGGVGGPERATAHLGPLSRPRIKISVNTDISVIGVYGNIGNIGKISVDIFTKISVIKFFYILII